MNRDEALESGTAKLEAIAECCRKAYENGYNAALEAKPPCACGGIPPNFIDGVRRGVAALNEGKITPWEEVKREMGLACACGGEKPWLKGFVYENAQEQLERNGRVCVYAYNRGPAEVPVLVSRALPAEGEKA